MVARLWSRARVYFGFADGPETEVRVDFGWDGVISGGVLGMGVAGLIGEPSIGAGVAALLAGSGFGWGLVRGGRALTGRRQSVQRRLRDEA